MVCSPWKVKHKHCCKGLEREGYFWLGSVIARRWFSILVYSNNPPSLTQKMNSVLSSSKNLAWCCFACLRWIIWVRQSSRREGEEATFTSYGNVAGSALNNLPGVLCGAAMKVWTLQHPSPHLVPSVLCLMFRLSCHSPRNMLQLLRYFNFRLSIMTPCDASPWPTTLALK